MYIVQMLHVCYMCVAHVVHTYVVHVSVVSTGTGKCECTLRACLCVWEGEGGGDRGWEYLMFSGLVILGSHMPVSERSPKRKHLCNITVL